ncbi:MAG: arylsulfatase [Gammaproteobacteria bacterium 39-13]|nr:arylsulfatase [Gammaproteobacteria bacterium]OJV96281.1 MAG: arylsulfatase [Gammaproteobacteria bacterium 39-13]
MLRSLYKNFTSGVILLGVACCAVAKDKQPNIIVIMGDDVGWFNIGAYNQGIMSGKTPNLDRLASEGMRFTDYYAEASCTAGRANFITGELPIRTGLTTVGQAGADVGMPDKAPTIATALKSMGYVTGQFGKNHFGDLNKYLPCVHGFDQFYGYLYHLDAMSDPYWHSYPKDPKFRDTFGPRNMVQCEATNKDDTTDMPRWGKIGKQKITDEGPLDPKRMETVDDEILAKTIAFMDKAKKDDKPFFIWLNPTRMHIWTFLSDKYKGMMNSDTNYGIEEAGMAQLDDIVGSVLEYLKKNGLEEDTIVVFTTDNGAEVFTWPDGGMTPFKQAKGTIYEGGFRVPALIRWPGKVPAGKVENGIFSGLDWFPTLVAAAGNSNIVEELKTGKKLGDKEFKVHLDGYNQMDLITGKGPSNRHEIFYFAEARLGAIRIDDFKYRFIDQKDGWPGAKDTLNMPTITNLRQDPFERAQEMNFTVGAPGYMDQFLAREFWRFVFVQDVVKKLAESAIQFPPMQKPASFNLEAIKDQITEKLNSHQGQ